MVDHESVRLGFAVARGGSLEPLPWPRRTLPDSTSTLVICMAQTIFGDVISRILPLEILEKDDDSGPKLRHPVDRRCEGFFGDDSPEYWTLPWLSLLRLRAKLAVDHPLGLGHHGVSFRLF